MPLEKLDISPGVVKDRTAYSSVGRWIDTQWMRFDEGQPTKMGGWAPRILGPTLPEKDITGALAWSDFKSTSMTVVNTSFNLKVVDPTNAPSTLIDITPAVALDAIDILVDATGPSFTSTQGSTQCVCAVVTDLTTLTRPIPLGTVVQLTGATPVGVIGGVAIPTEVVVSVVDGAGLSFTFTLPTPALTSETLNTVGLYATFTVQDTTTITGTQGTYNSGTYGVGPYGAATTAGATTPYWTKDTFGQLYVATQDGVGPVVWCEPDGTPPVFTNATPALTIRALRLADLDGAAATTPTRADMILASGTSRHLIVGGTTDIAGDYNPLLVRWASQESLTDWFPQATNTAGSYPLSDGSYIVTGARLRREALIWTDTALYSVQYIGGQEVFGITAIATNISIASARSVVVYNDTAYWMGTGKFYSYDGRVSEIPCSITNHVFRDLANFSQVHAGLNLAFNEVMWFYTGTGSAASSTPCYALYNHKDKVWANGELPRSMWYDTANLTLPLAADGTALMNQESGIDAVSAVGNDALPAHIESGDMDINSGNEFSFVRRMIPDIDFRGSAEHAKVRMSVAPRRAPGDAAMYGGLLSGVTESGTDVTRYTERVGLRLRARQLRVRIESTEPLTTWRVGTQRIDAQPDGER